MREVITSPTTKFARMRPSAFERRARRQLPKCLARASSATAAAAADTIAPKMAETMKLVALCPPTPTALNYPAEKVRPRPPPRHSVAISGAASLERRIGARRCAAFVDHDL
jgi:hypothetical protein